MNSFISCPVHKMLFVMLKGALFSAPKFSVYNSRGRGKKNLKGGLCLIKP